MGGDWGNQADEARRARLEDRMATIPPLIEQPNNQSAASAMPSSIRLFLALDVLELKVFVERNDAGSSLMSTRGQGFPTLLRTLSLLRLMRRQPVRVCPTPNWLAQASS